MPAALRTALHAEAARELAATGADALSVAQQLSAAGQPGKGWARAWLVQAAPVLTTRAPQLAVDLLRRELDETPSGDEAWDGLTASLVWALFAAGSYDGGGQAGQRGADRDDRPGAAGRDVLGAGARSGQRGRLRRGGRHRAAGAGVGRPAPHLAGPDAGACCAMLERAGTGDLDAADVTARQALAVAEEAGDAFATAHALTDLWLSHGVRRDHAAALGYVDRALRVLGDDPGYADLRSYALDGRIFTLQNLDRWPEAELTLRQAREFAQRSGRPDRATWVTAAVLRYWLGQWDDALAELSPDEDDDAPRLTATFLRERWAALLVHGVTALIAGRRDQRTTAESAPSPGPGPSRPGCRRP